jgi:hypothetical protein
MTATTMQRPVRSADPATHPAFTGIPFARLLGVEWRKATDTRAARSLLVFAALSTAGLMLIPLLSRARVDQTYGSYLFQAAIGLSILLPVVSILTLTSEWSQRTVLTTFTQEPRRLRVVSAKVVVSLLLAVGGIVYGVLVTVTSLAIAAASGRELTSDLNAGVIVGFIVYVVLQVLLGVAVGALLHNSAVAITLSFVLPTTSAFLGHAWKAAGDWFDPTTTFGWLLHGQWSGHTPQIVVSIFVWVAIPLAAGLVRTVRREIK